MKENNEPQIDRLTTEFVSDQNDRIKFIESLTTYVKLLKKIIDDRDNHLPKLSNNIKGIQNVEQACKDLTQIYELTLKDLSDIIFKTNQLTFTFFGQVTRFDNLGFIDKLNDLNNRYNKSSHNDPKELVDYCTELHTLIKEHYFLLKHTLRSINN